jgi:predicted PolB exonuclease-like 3'-5' exonuclease
MNIFIDIETIPNQSIDKPIFDESTVAVGNLKDPEKIKEKIERAKSEFENGITKEMSVNSDLCQIISIGCIVTDTDYNIVEERVFFNENDDKKILSEFKSFLKTIPVYTFYGWNIKYFDIPVIWKRGILTGEKAITTPDYLEMISKYRNYSVDLKHVWSNDQYYKLSTCCKTLGIPCKTGLDGSMIYDAWKEKKFEEIKAYNLEDCYACIEIARKIY